MKENDLDKVLNYMKRYVENVYEHDSEIMLNWKDIKLVLEEIERLNNIKKKAINELFNLKDMIYKPETRKINFDIQNKISSIIKILGSDKE